ncbi:MAG: GNAT family N-acetyltransferase [Erysipelotrichaceae bacterium]|nr:GNAT family N-acetyltransferase [Erysipelotrichaceae bacterium]
MIYLKPVTLDDLDSFSETEYEQMSEEEKIRMITESRQQEHDGRYFELLRVCDDDQIVGFMSLFAHSEHVISIGPQIRKSFRGKGYGSKGELLALQYAHDKGFDTAVSWVRHDNTTSLRLHEKLGFEIQQNDYIRNGKHYIIYIKELN